MAVLECLYVPATRESNQAPLQQCVGLTERAQGEAARPWIVNIN